MPCAVSLSHRTLLDPTRSFQTKTTSEGTQRPTPSRVHTEHRRDSVKPRKGIWGTTDPDKVASATRSGGIVLRPEDLGPE